MKLCKDCAHFRAPAHADVSEYAKCGFGMLESPVTGLVELKTQSSSYCITLRLSSVASDCGKDARHFDTKAAAPTYAAAEFRVLS